MALSSSTIIGVGILAGVATLVLMPEICIAGIVIGPEGLSSHCRRFGQDSLAGASPSGGKAGRQGRSGRRTS
jgi:hypothetical protein